ncbi:uncharacterized protein [Littorina saxatilis]|uniref:uncharacterized protein n=1 Tax=Littorina saxatilis TaxID=31220 RepID=UPI0038B61702
MPAQCSVAPSSALPCLFHVSPPLFLNGGKTVIHLGGEDKFVPLSPQRVKVINITDDVTFILTLQGQPGENVTMLYYVNNVGRKFSAIIAPDGVTNVELDITSPVTTSTAVVTSEPMTTTGGHASRTSAATSVSLLSVFIVSVLVAMLK